MWFSFLIAITKFFKKFSCYISLALCHCLLHIILFFLSLWSTQMWFFLLFFPSNYKIALVKINLGTDACGCWWLLFCISWTRKFLLTSTVSHISKDKYINMFVIFYTKSWKNKIYRLCQKGSFCCLCTLGPLSYLDLPCSQWLEGWPWHFSKSLVFGFQVILCQREALVRYL